MISGAAVHTAIQNDVVTAAAPANADDESHVHEGLLIVLAVQIPDPHRTSDAPPQLHAGAFPVIEEYHGGGFKGAARPLCAFLP